jgi:hypothetical protein
MEEEHVKSKEERVKATKEIIEKGHEDIVGQLAQKRVDDAWTCLIAMVDDGIRAIRKEPSADEERRKRDKEEEGCRQRWPMAFSERKVFAPAAETCGMMSASDPMVTKRRNQARRIEEALVKERLCENHEAEGETRKKKEGELQSLMEEEYAARSRSAFGRHTTYGGKEVRRKGSKDSWKKQKQSKMKKRRRATKEISKGKRDPRGGGKGGAWKLMKGEARGRILAARRRDGTITANPREMLQEACDYWQGILNQERRIDIEAYKEEYKEEFNKIRGEEVELRKLTKDDFVESVRRLKKSAAPGVDSLTVAEIRWLPASF